MIHQRQRIASFVILVSDLLALTTGFLGAWYVRFGSGHLPVPKGVPDFDRYLELLAPVLLLFPLVFYFHGLYQGRSPKSRVDEAFSVLIAVGLGTVLLSGALTFYRPLHQTNPAEPFTYSRSFLLFFALFSVVAVVLFRAGSRSLLKTASLRFGEREKILIVGAGRLGREVAQKLISHRDLGVEVVGFLDDDPGKAQRQFSGVPVLGTLRDIESVLEQVRPDQVLVALPLEAHKKMLRVLQTVARECVEVKLVPDILQYATLKATLEDLDGTPIINLSQVPLQGWHSLVKRVLDLGISAMGLLLLAPAFGLIALAIWLEDRGPIFYSQERMGLDGRLFRIWKFRSMRVDAEATTGPVWAIKDDPRRTRVGAFLRRWSLDELPQLWNVLRGEMSLVGPRPERPAFVAEFKQRLPQYMLRHRVKAGITGWAQVHGWRGNTSIRKRLEYDLYYIENWSLALDLKILWMTLRHGLRHNAH